MNRETYLNKAITQFRPMFKSVGAPLPANIRVTCGFPSKSAGRSSKQRIGECWSERASGDKTIEVIISMVLDDPIKVLGTLSHELVHAAVGLECGHKGAFKTIATKIGHTGKMTTTECGAELTAKLEKMSAKLGTYPHAKIDFDNRKKQSTRMVKVTCDNAECGMIFRTSAKWIDQEPNMACPICAAPTTTG